ncbi:MAG TPA: PEP-CTERM sorting domain-containing protein [Casimicrobiaceae bacterium]|jgi:hypothetical protein
MKRLLFAMTAAALGVAMPAAATPFFFSTGDVTNAIAVATRPDTPGKFEIEAGDDFVASRGIFVNSATFTGLLTGGATTGDIGQVVVEIYRVFPLDSDVGRTSGPPVFSTDNVPTRVNSPSDVAFDDRDSAVPTLTFTTDTLADTFVALNSVQPGGIHPKPGQTTGGNGAVTGTEVQFNVSFTTPFQLPAGHYFFVPQVEVTTASGEFLWLSGTRPIVPPGTPFAPDLQSWTRDDSAGGINPDWLRVGTDIVGAGTFNQAFTLNGRLPEPGTLVLLGLGLVALAVLHRKRR